MNKEFVTAYEVLSSVFKDKAYASIALDKVAGDKTVNFKLITKLVYGVLERNVELDYYIGKIADKSPRSGIAIIIKIGLYSLIYIDSMQDYAVVHSCVELCEYIRKPQLKGFVNALLNNYINKKNAIELPTNPDERLSIAQSKPLWLVKAYNKQYGKDKALEILSADTDGREHVRLNNRKITVAEAEKAFDDNHIDYNISEYGGYYISNGKPIRELFDSGMITIQSPSSMLVCLALGIENSDSPTVLDMCAAPGGKSVYLSELNLSAIITAGDIHQHRVELVNKYAVRMDADNINAILLDGRKVTEQFGKESFDFVLCDAPCSGLGVAYRKPDILLDSNLDKCMELSLLQYDLLNSAVDAVKVGGYVVYSTCTTLREENMNVVGKLLKERNDIVLERLPLKYDNNGVLQLLPGRGLDGFYIARLKKIIRS